MKISDLKNVKVSAILLFAVLLTACLGGGGGGSGGGGVTTPSLYAVGYDIKQLVFTWPAVSGADLYRMTENPDGASGYSQIGADIPAGTTTYTHDIAVHLQDWLNASYILESCDGGVCTDSAARQATDSTQAIGYLKAAATAADEMFGHAVAISGDGSTVAVGAWSEDGASSNEGAVYLFDNSGGSWQAVATIKASNAAINDYFGWSVALSNDGSVLAVGAYGRDDGAVDQGAAYIYSGANWANETYITASNAVLSDSFGSSVSLSSDGTTLAVGAYGRDDAQVNQGAVYLYDGVGWANETYITAAAPGLNDYLGWSVSMSGDASTVAAGAYGKDDGAVDQGAVYIFNGAGWATETYITASNAGLNDWFGSAVSLSSDASTLAVGTYREDDAANDAGAVYVYSGAGWADETILRASNAALEDNFGWSVSLNSDGTILAAGAYLEDGGSSGVGGNEADNSASGSGAVYVFSYSGAAWAQSAYVKASNTGAGDKFGHSVALSADGNSMVVGADNERSNATDIGGDQADDSLAQAGAAYLY